MYENLGHFPYTYHLNCSLFVFVSQAMADFRQMFPTMEDDVIEAVLRANDGAVDATIDQLLTMSIDAGQEEVIDPVTHTVVVSIHGTR